MKVLEIATVGELPADLVSTLRAFPFTKLVLLHESAHAEAAEYVAEVGATLLAEVERVAVDPVSVPRVLQILADVQARHSPGFDEAFVNVTSGHPALCGAVTHAAGLVGLDALAVHPHGTLRFPAAAVPYWRFISGPKEGILSALVGSGGWFPSLTDLAHATGLDTGALNYHLRDGNHRRGLLDLGLVRAQRTGGAVAIEVTPAGRLAIRRKHEEAVRRGTSVEVTPAGEKTSGRAAAR